MFSIMITGMRQTAAANATLFIVFTSVELSVFELIYVIYLFTLWKLRWDAGFSFAT